MNLNQESCDLALKVIAAAINTLDDDVIDDLIMIGKCPYPTQLLSKHQSPFECPLCEDIIYPGDHHSEPEMVMIFDSNDIINTAYLEDYYLKKKEEEKEV